MMVCDKGVCVCDKVVCDKVVCERWCVTKVCAKDGSEDFVFGVATVSKCRFGFASRGHYHCSF